MFKFVKAEDLTSIVEEGKREKERKQRELVELTKESIQNRILEQAKDGETYVKSYINGKIKEKEELKNFFIDLGYKVKLNWSSNCNQYYLDISWEQEEQ